MFIPRYWSEASQFEKLPDRKQVTIRRFGWSSVSQDEADVHARRRVEEALAVLREQGPAGLRGLTRREHKVAYAGSDGLPIREEIVREWEADDVVVTRNGYGALCLNTTRAMFVDVDRPVSRVAEFGCVIVLVGAIAGWLVGKFVLHWKPFVAAIAGATLLGWLAVSIGRLRQRLRLHSRSPLQWAVERSRQWCESRPDWRVLVYETPGGARLLAVHAAFDAGDEATYEFMSFVGVDKLYERMCRLQKCFRARVSPKPWRAGVHEHFRAGGTWPVRDPEKLAARARWVEEYERATRAYASCRFVEAVGSGRTDPAIDRIRALHDEMCQAQSRLDLA